MYHNVVCPQEMSALGGSPLRLLCPTHRTSAHQKSLGVMPREPLQTCCVSHTDVSVHTLHVSEPYNCASLS